MSSAHLVHFSPEVGPQRLLKSTAQQHAGPGLFFLPAVNIAVAGAIANVFSGGAAELTRSSQIRESRQAGKDRGRQCGGLLAMTIRAGITPHEARPGVIVRR